MMRARACVLAAVLAIAIFAIVSCETDDDAVGSTDTGEDEPNDGEPSEFPAFFLDRPELLDWSSWSTQVDHVDPPLDRSLGGVGVGNGKVFGILAGFSPLTTLRNHNGPTYQKHLRFFSEQTLSLFQGEGPVEWEAEACYRVRQTAVYVTRMQRGDLTMWVVDFAPAGGRLAEWQADRAIVRHVVLYNRGAETVPGLALSASSTLGHAQDGRIRELILESHRELVAGFPSAEASANQKRTITVQVGDLAPGASWETRYQIAYASGTDPMTPYAATAALDIDGLLGPTLDYWRAFSDAGSRVVTPDERVNDLLEGIAVGIETQQAEGGCFAQMSEYGYNALRDLYGVSRFFPLTGRTQDYRRMLDYVWMAMREYGNVRADVDIDLTFDPEPAEPDWENLPTLSGRARAESPSYLILHYKEYLDATGDMEPVAERYGMLRHALIHQDVREGCLLPFSDDETYRIAMMIAFGHDVREGYVDKYLSANSSFLYVVAAEFMADVARALGLTDHAAEYDEMAASVRRCTEDSYWLDAGYYAPLLDIDTLRPVGRPFEDVNTKPTWLGYLAPDDPRAESNLAETLGRLEREGGFYYSPLHPKYKPLARLLGFEKGVVTGMAFGYELDTLARMDHPAAADAFGMAERFFHSTGMVSEAHVVDDFGRVMYLAEPTGALCDLTARYRSWESGINGAAMIEYLFGLELDAANGRVAVAPHLPPGWSEARKEQVRVGDTRFDRETEDDGAVRRVTLSVATGVLTVDAAVSVAGAIAKVTVNGEAAGADTAERWGRTRAVLTGLSLAPDADLVVEVTRASD